uniref:MAP kinase-activating death domain protein n=1 Tax=Parascaris univalens TaxID=6257 RepID=A0A915A4M9_PARUN
MDEKGKELCPRLIDYLVIVGRRCWVSRNSQLSFDGASSSNTVTNPELLRRYPTDDHKDFYLPNDVTVFCQPEGCLTKGAPRRTQSIRESHSFVFTLTEKDSAKIRYGICLNFFQSFERSKSGNVNQPRSSPENSGKNRRREQRLSLTSLCLISHHPFLSTFRELLTLLKKLIDSCGQRSALSGTIPKGAVWSVLTGHWTEAIPPNVMREIRELETWILMLLSAPVPVPGKTKVQLEVMPLSIMPILEFALPDHTRFSLVDFPMHLPLELLGVDTAVKVLEAVMLEYKVVLQSRNYNAVSMCVMAIVALLYPLEYMFPVIPLLPSHMPSAEQLLFAPTPFIIGVPASFFSYKKISTMPNDVILVDLDTNQMVMPESMVLPELPEPDCTNLKNSFRASLGRMTMNAPNMNSEGRQGSFESSYSVDSDVIDVAVRVAMIRFLNSPNVFANFSEHTRTLRLYPRPVVALQTESFLRSRPQFTQFVLDLCKTQAVEYFAECSLCPRNETYVRVQTGTDSPAQIGDKSKWFTDSLMPVHFTVYPNDSTLAAAWHAAVHVSMNSLSDSDEENGSDAGNTDAGSCSSIDDLVFESPDEIDPTSGASKPLGEVNDVYREPLTLELPQSESALSIGSSLSSGRSSPSSSVSTSAMDSEADFARLAENLALKSDSKGDFSFDHSDENTPVQNRKGLATGRGLNSQPESAGSTPTNRTPPLRVVGMKSIAHLTDSGEKVLGPQFLSALNGYAEKSHDMFNQMLNRTAPKAQALRDKTVRPIAVAAANRMEQSQHLVKSKTSSLSNTNTAIQQSKNQQVVREICDQVLSGQGVGVFTYPRLKRLMEDESLRQLVCSKLNLGLETKHSEDDFVQDMQLTRTQYKGYVKVLQTCIVGLENCFNTPGSNGLASLFHVLEIAHTHYWAKEAESTTPGSGLNTPSASVHDFQPLRQHRLPSTLIDGRPPPPIPPPLPPPPVVANRDNDSVKLGSSEGTRETAPREVHGVILPTGPPPPLPPRPLPLRQQSATGGNKLVKSKAESEDSQSQISDESRTITTPIPHNDSSTKLDQHEKSETNAVVASQPSSGPSSATPTSTPHDARPLPPRTLLMESASTLDSSEPVRHYIYQDLILPSQNPLWRKMVFWENAFFDVVAQERDIVGMDQEPCEMIDRYSGLSESEKKRLELDEDRLLATLLHNLTAYMIMCGTGQKAIQQKIRRLLGKAHIGLVYSKTINQLLDHLPQTQGNGIPLKPLGSRLMQKQSFTVHVGANAQGTLMFMEVCDDAVVLRAVTGAITDRWWYERLVNMTYSPKTKVLCLWRRHEDKVHMHKFHTKKCRELYACMKTAMERAAARGKVAVAGRDLGGEFPIHDAESNQGGLLQVRIDGVALLFADRQHFIELNNIKKCNTFGGSIFVLEEYDRRKNELVQRRYMSQMACEIAWTLHRVFSVCFSLNALGAEVMHSENGSSSLYSRLVVGGASPALVRIRDVGDPIASAPEDNDLNALCRYEGD